MKKSLIFLITFFIFGCPEEKPPGIDYVDVEEEEVALPEEVLVELPDIPPDLFDVDWIKEVEDVKDVEAEVQQNPPQITFAFLTSKGPKGWDEEEVSLSSEDETEIYKGTPGFQVDILTKTLNLENGMDVKLYIQNNLITTKKVVVNAETGIGDVLFFNVSLTHSIVGYEVKIESTSQKTGLTGSSVKILKLDIGKCGIEISPKNTSCLLDDEEGQIAGYQKVFVVKNPDNTCDSAKIKFESTLKKGESEVINLDENGSANIKVTLFDSDKGLNGVPVFISAVVMDSANPDRTEESPPLEYNVDTDDPIIKITSPTKTTLNLNDDKNFNPADGIQFDLGGNVSGLPSPELSSIFLKINGTPYEKSVYPTPDGNFVFKDLTLSSDGIFKFTLSVEDQCKRNGEAQAEITAIVTLATLKIMSPMNGLTLYAKDDENLATKFLYETKFKVLAKSLVDVTELSVVCKEDAVGAPLKVVGKITDFPSSPDDIYTIPVVLNVELQKDKQKCFVKDNAPNPSKSEEIIITIALPPPELYIVDPQENSFINNYNLNINLNAINLEGVKPDFKILAGGGALVLTKTSDKLIKNYGLTTTLELKANGSFISDGTYTFGVDAVDKYGNLASDIPLNKISTPFILDTKPPLPIIVKPVKDVLDPELYPEDKDENPQDLGFQTEVEVKMIENNLKGSEVCVKINDNQKKCSILKKGENSSVFPDITFISGENKISTYATDPAQNKGYGQDRIVTLNIDSPRVLIVQPPNDGPVVSLPVNFKIKVEDYKTKSPIQDAEVTLIQDDNPLETKQSGNDGFAEFSVNSVPQKDTIFVAKALINGKEGYSAPRKISYKTSVPAIEFKFPFNDMLINLNTKECSSGLNDCLTNVVLSTLNVEDDSAGELVVKCKENEKKYNSLVKSNEIIFKNVTLFDQSFCELSVSVTDIGGSTANAGPIKISVDRTPPKILSFVKPTKSYLTYVDDENLINKGLQYTIEVKISGIEKGQEVTLIITPEGLNPTLLKTEVPVDVPDNGEYILSFPQTTLPEGNVILMVEAEDKAKNSASPFTKFIKLINIEGEKPSIVFTAPLYVENKPCTKSSQCGAGNVCVSEKCATGWGKLSTKTVIVSAKGIATEYNNLRICSSNPAVQGVPCQTNGYRQLALTNFSGVTKEVNLDGIIDGMHTIIAEAMWVEGEKWITTLDEIPQQDQKRYIYVDTIPPKVLSLFSPSDTKSPFLVLNIEEQKLIPRIYEILSDINETGKTSLYINEAKVETKEHFAGSVLFDAQLKEGANVIYVVSQDDVGNYSPVPPSKDVIYYAPSVDTTKPLITIINPVKDILIKGDNLDIVFQSDEIGGKIDLYDKDALKGSLPVASNGKAIFSHSTYGILTDGDHIIKGFIKDFGENQNSVEKAFIVDTLLPQISIEKPEDFSIFSDNDDAQPQIGGFQIEVKFGTTSPDATQWEIQLSMNCDSSWTLCDPPVKKSSGSFKNIGGMEESEFVTIPVGETQFYKLLVIAKDGSGNSAAEIARIKIELKNCIMSIVGIPNTGYFNNTFCDVSGENCASIKRNIKVQFVGPCGNIDKLQLLKDDNVAGETSQFQGNEATFNVQFNDGENVNLEGRGLINGEVFVTSGKIPVKVDLKDPAAKFISENVQGFITPETGSNNIYNAKSDQDKGKNDLQIHLKLNATDLNIIGGEIKSLERITDNKTYQLTASNVTFPYPIINGSLPLSILNITLPDQKDNIVKVIVKDAAGNESSTFFSASVDILPPLAIEFAAFASSDINTRKPSVRLKWTSVGDNGIESGTKAAEYDIRYSTFLIKNEKDFLSACKVKNLAFVDPLPIPKVAGTFESYTVTGPDVRSPDYKENEQPCYFVTGVDSGEYYFAIRAIDDAGNESEIGEKSVISANLSLRYALIYGDGDYKNDDLNRIVTYLGNIDGDTKGRGDIGLGGLSLNGFCVVYGHGEGADLTIPDLTIESSSGTFHKCVSGNKNLGYQLAYLGDINGDGIDDFAAGEGDPLGTPPNKVNVFLGVKDGFFSSTPNIIIEGAKPQFPGAIIGGGGNFNGDKFDDKPLNDIIVSSKSENKVFIIPGNSSWSNSTNIKIDLSKSEDHTTYKIVTIQLIGGGYQFGFFATFLGDIFKDNFDEVAISQFKSPTLVYIIRGRKIEEKTLIELSNENTGIGDDAKTVRLIPDAEADEKSFGYFMQGRKDVDGDNIPDVLVGQYLGAKTIYIFYGKSIVEKGSGPLSINANTKISPIVYKSEKGIAIKGSYLNPAFIGNFDNESSQNPSIDIGYTIFSTQFKYGKVYIHFNIKDSQNNIPYGSFPYQSIILSNPLDPQSIKFGHRSVISIGDFNGDGFYDIIVGTNGEGYAIIFY